MIQKLLFVQVLTKLLAVTEFFRERPAEGIVIDHQMLEIFQISNPGADQSLEPFKGGRFAVVGDVVAFEGVLEPNLLHFLEVVEGLWDGSKH